MSDFISGFWSPYIITVVGLSFVYMAYLLISNRSKLGKDEHPKLLDHVWDDDLQELNNPMPRWWLWLFVATLVFGAVYLVLYPGLGSLPGVFKWSQTGQLQQEEQQIRQVSEPLYNRYKNQPVEQLAQDPQARQMGERLFLTYCMQCHGTDARGAKGFPNLRDNDWLWGSSPEAIKTTITQGRTAMMPAWGSQLGDDGVKNVVQYVMSLSGRKHDDVRAAAGKNIFKSTCAGCHGGDGKGNPAMGAPNLTDKTWLYGGSEKALIESVAKGRNGAMPAHGPLLGEARIHLLTAYIYGFPKEQNE